jgi:filamentous hemagglutinin family protein
MVGRADVIGSFLRISRKLAPGWLAHALVLAWASGAHAGVTIDGTISPAATLVGPAYQINEAHGQRVVGNLFHSFGQFSIATGESATFNGSTGIANIIGRVTGGALASIDGQIASSIANANLYLVNPAGFLFGPNASLNVSGSFYASSANYVKLSDGSLFHASNPAASALTSAPPATFGFLGGNGALEVNGSRLVLTPNAGQPPPTLGLAGGDVTVKNATLDVSEGASAVSGGGRISIRGGQIVLNNARVLAKTVNGNGQSIELSASGDIVINGGEVVGVTTGKGNSAAIGISGNNVTISGAALVDTSCDPGCTSGTGGALNVAAANRLAITGDVASVIPTGVVSNSFGGGSTGTISLAAKSIELNGAALVQSLSLAAGNAAGVAIAAEQLSISQGAQVDVSSRSTGQAGTLQARVSGATTISGGRIDPGSLLPLPSGLFGNAEASANGGTIALDTATLSVEAGGEISSSSRAGATGRGGAIGISATGNIRIAGRDANGKASVIAVNSFGAGDAGSITVAAPLLEIADGGLVQSQSQNIGNSSSITLNVGSLVLLNGGQVSADARALGAGGSVIVKATGGVYASGLNTGLFAKTYAFGSGGNIVVNAATLDLSNQGGIFAGTDGLGAGGSIRITTSNGTALSSGATITSQSAFLGLAGNIALDAGRVLRMDGSSITARARQADGGNIAISARDLISLNRSQIATEVGTGFGSGGNITIDPTFLVLNASSIVANAFGGDGGNITIVAENFFKSPDSIVSASSQLGAPGIIDISSPVVDVSGSLADLPVSYLSAASLLANPCAARLAGKSSSLVVAGRGGVPYSADGYLPASVSFAADPPQASAPSTLRPGNIASANGRSFISCGST